MIHHREIQKRFKKKRESQENGAELKKAARSLRKMLRKTGKIQGRGRVKITCILVMADMAKSLQTKGSGRNLKGVN